MTFTYTPKKYFKNVMYNNTGNFERDFLAFSACIYRNIEASTAKTKTKKLYKGFLRNRAGFIEMINFLHSERLITYDEVNPFVNYDDVGNYHIRNFNHIEILLKNLYKL